MICKVFGLEKTIPQDVWGENALDAEQIIMGH